MKAEELKQNYIRYHKTADGKHKGVSLEFANEIEMNSFLQQYAEQESREVNNDSFWFDQFNERYPDEVAEIFNENF